MAAVDFTPAPTFRPAGPRSKMNAYFALLIVALIAMMLACLFMYLEINNLGGFGKVQGRVSAVERMRATSLAHKPEAPAKDAERTQARSASEGMVQRTFA